MAGAIATMVLGCDDASGAGTYGLTAGSRSRHNLDLHDGYIGRCDTGNDRFRDTPPHTRTTDMGRFRTLLARSGSPARVRVGCRRKIEMTPGARNSAKFIDLFDGVFVLEVDLDTTDSEPANNE